MGNNIKIPEVPEGRDCKDFAWACSIFILDRREGKERKFWHVDSRSTLPEIVLVEEMK